MPVNLRVDNFSNEIINSQLPVLVDFWAPWCGPCKMIAPYIDELANIYADRLKICKLNVDEAPAIATEYAVMSIPALMLFKQGKVIERRVGAMSKKDIEKFIQSYL